MLATQLFSNTTASAIRRCYYHGKQMYKPLETADFFSRFLIVPNCQKLLPFQKGIIKSNISLEMLHNYLKERFNMTYICTSRLNQDVLEHFFGAIRSTGGLNDHPTPQDFKYRMRKYILGTSITLHVYY